MKRTPPYRLVDSARALLALLTLALTAAPAPSSAAATPSSAHRPDVIRCATHELQARFGRASGPAGRAGGPCAGTPVGPPANPTIGSSWDWYIWRLNGAPVADLKSCTVRGMGAHCYVVVEDSQWNVNIDQAQVDTIVDTFENHSIGPFPSEGIWQLDTTNFGDPPDNLDMDPRVYFVYYDFDISADGFFWSFDQQCDNVAQYHSNECDAVYLNDSDFDPAGEYMLAVLAHEFEHLIHYNYDTNEASWVDEGMAELAMWLYGNPDDISSFNTNPDVSLITFTGVWADYIKAYLFSLYFYERYGGQPAVRALVAEPANSIAGYEAVLDAFSYPENFTDVFQDWTVANWLDDPSLADGRYGYVGETLPPFNDFVTATSYPFGPLTGSVNYWAADYVTYTNGNALVTTFNGADNNTFAVRAILTDPVSTTQVVDMPLDSAQAGVLPLPDIGTTYTDAVLVYMGAGSSGTKTYQYGAYEGAVAAPVVAAGGPLALRALDSGTSQPRLALTVPADWRGEPMHLDVYDVRGRHLGRWLDAPASPGTRVLPFAGADGAPVSGVYFVRLGVGSHTVTTRVSVVR
jgi:hypothetical protein